MYFLLKKPEILKKDSLRFFRVLKILRYFFEFKLINSSRFYYNINKDNLIQKLINLVFFFYFESNENIKIKIFIF